ncbi:MAG: OmpA family protein [Nitrospira sp. BO4]|jgi:chemotaxis protein MotB|nr:OmpA family protein [Nitrospira sp. BO4]
MKLLALVLASTFTLINGHVPSIAAGFQATSSTSTTPLYKVHDDHFPQNKYSFPPQTSKGEAEKEPSLDKLQQQLSAKEKELSLLREKATAANDLLNAEKQRVGVLETQLAQKEQALNALRDPGDSHSQPSQELSTTKSDLQQAKQRIEDLERQLAVSSLENAKRRIVELERQLDAEKKGARVPRSEPDDNSKLNGDVPSQTGELTQARNRVVELEQQLAGKEQDLAQLKDNLKQVTQKLTDLDPQLTARNAELAQAKQLLAEMERNSTKQGEAAPTQEPHPVRPDDAKAIGSDLTKVSESLSSALQDELKKGRVGLRQRGNKLTLALATGELFGSGEVMMTPGGASLLERIGAILHDFRYQSIEVAGHTDSKPVRSDPRRTFRDNIELSQARAEHAGQALIGSGVEADRVKSVGYAATRPIASNDTDKGRSKNRRVEIIVTQWSEPSVLSGEKDNHVGKKSRVASRHHKGVTQRVVNR